MLHWLSKVLLSVDFPYKKPDATQWNHFYLLFFIQYNLKSRTSPSRYLQWLLPYQNDWATQPYAALSNLSYLLIEWNLRLKPPYIPWIEQNSYFLRLQIVLYQALRYPKRRVILAVLMGPSWIIHQNPHLSVSDGDAREGFPLNK